MRPTAVLRAAAGRPGFLRRSMDDALRLSKAALNQEGLRRPTHDLPLIDFHDASSLAACKSMSDGDLGGFSLAALDAIPAAGPTPAHARFHGTISTALPADRPRVQRTGYAGWRTLDRPASLFGTGVWDVDPYTYLALRVKSDGRKYFVNVQTASIVPTDLHQHRLYTTRPGEWETVVIPWHEFVRTNHGVAVEPQAEMLRQQVRTVGIGLTDRIPGPFELCVQRLWATNRSPTEPADGERDPDPDPDPDGHGGPHDKDRHGTGQATDSRRGRDLTGPCSSPVEGWMDGGRRGSRPPG